MAAKPLDIVIIGGSLAGLMQGIMLKRLGHNIRILEQYPTSVREGQAAGMSTGGYGQKFLEKHDRIQDHPHFVSASTLQITDINLRVTETRKVPFKLTNWKTLYYRLRANFDGLTSEYVPAPPEDLPTDGKVVYDVRKRVTDISYEKNSGIAVKFEDAEQGDSEVLHPDLVIAADGANSTIRNLLSPNLDVPYAGFFTWRGVIEERNVSEEARKLLDDKCIRYRTDGGYIVAYTIPGENGSNVPGERHINLVWYYNCSQSSPEYAAAMTDVNGVQHQRTVPFGKVRPELWAKQQAHSNEKFAVPIKEMVNKIEVPFVTAISDCVSPRASFYDGKLFLVGDALALFRPNVAQSTNQSALHCLLLERYFQGGITLQRYEKEVMSFAHTTLLWSRDVSSGYLQGFPGHFYHKIRHQLARRTQPRGVRL